MKRQNRYGWLAVVVAGTLALISWNAAADDGSGTVAVQLPNGAAQIVKMKQAQISDDTVIAYIRSSGHGFALNAGQIIYLRQQGITDAVLVAMLNQPKASAVAAVPAVVAAPAPEPVAASPTPTVAAPVATVAVPPAVTYVQTVPAYYYAPVYYPAYRLYGGPHVAVGWGWRGGWHVGVGLW